MMTTTILLLLIAVSTAQDLDLVWESHDLGRSIGIPGYALGDFDGDGKQELFLATAMGKKIMAVEHVGDTYSITGKVRRDTEDDIIVTFAAMDGYGIVATLNDTFEVYDLNTRETLFYSVSYVGASTALFVATTDLNGDGVVEAFFTVGSTLVSINIDAPYIFFNEYVDMPTGKAVMGSFTGPNLKQIAYTDGRIFQYDFSFNEVQGFVSAFTSNNFLVSIDVDEDGVDEIVAMDAVVIACYSALDYGIVWTHRPSPSGIDTLDVFDVNSDGRMEVVYGDDQWGDIWALDGVTGLPFWNVDFVNWGISRVIVGDMDADGVNEIIWVSEDILFIANGEGEIAWQSRIVSPPFYHVAFDETVQDLTLIYASGDSSSNSHLTVVDVLTGIEMWSQRPSFYIGTVFCMTVADLYGNGSIIVAGGRGAYSSVLFTQVSTGTLLGYAILGTVGDASWVIPLDLDSDGTIEAIAVANNKINIVDPNTYEVTQSSPEVGEPFVQLAVATDPIGGADVVYALTAVGDIWMYHPPNNLLLEQPLLNPLPTSISSLRLNGEKVLAYGTASGAVAVLDDATIAPIVVCGGSVRYLNEAADGRLSFSCDDSFGIVDVAAGFVVLTEQLSEEDAGPGIVRVTVTEDGRSFVAWGNDVSARVMEIMV